MNALSTLLQPIKPSAIATFTKTLATRTHRNKSASPTRTHFKATPSGTPKLKIEFDPPSPWNIRPGENLELNITIKNEGSSIANNVRLTLTAPRGFNISQSGTNIYTKNFTKFEVEKIEPLNITVSIVKPGNYTITITILADNVPKKSYNHQITVELPYIP